MRPTLAPGFPALRIRGSALIVIYWIIALLSLLVFTSANLLFSEFATQSQQGQRFRAHQLAEMGLAVAAHPQVERRDGILRRQWNDFESYEATIESETSRLNLNAVLQRNDTEVLSRLFEEWGLRPEVADDVIATLLDWVDADDLLSPGGGAEVEQYARLGLVGLPPNRRFLSLDEVSSVRGIEVLSALKPDWLDSFTLFGNGKLSLQDADADLISAACGCSLSAAKDFVELREGRDGIPHTEDDVQLSSVDEALNLLDVPAVGRDAIVGRVTLQGNTFRLRSVGRVVDTRVERWLVVRGRGPGMRVLKVGSRSLKGPESSPR